ncbi:putative phage abortive infection protein [Pseudomonas pharyngis]|uniref:putative phage abortive infection protein n=1 Tax=Pseudomonas pharyngis TaxID=2892333 RepID=UPI003FD37FBD
MKAIQSAAILLLVAGCIILILFLNKSAIDGYSISNSLKTDFQVTGQFGDFVGGVVGTFFALSGTLLIYLNFKEQTKENKRSAFESSFFEMIRLYRSNVSELKYKKEKSSETNTLENRQVLREIFKEFEECYKEVRKFSNSKDPLDYLNLKHAKNLIAIIKNINPKINIIEMAAIDLAFLIVFYGLSSEGEQIIKSQINGRYNPDYYFELLFYIKLKPKHSNNSRFDNWKKLLKLTHKEFLGTVHTLYTNRKNPNAIDTNNQLAIDFKINQPYEKYYSGHQFRLGHYFRHLYQSYKYLNNHPDLDIKEKYEYGKMYRAQLSTYEQALLLINSISSLGMKWEYTPEESTNKKPNTANLITKYNLIKNLPGKHLSGIRYKTYYPNVKYESEE